MEVGSEAEEVNWHHYRCRTSCTAPGEQTLESRSHLSLLRSKTFSYAFDTTGDWTVKVTFTDSEGESDSETLNVKVYDPITVQLGATEYTVSESAWTAAVTVTASGSLPVPFSVSASGERRDGGIS